MSQGPAQGPKTKDLQLTQNASSVNVDDNISRGELPVFVGHAIWHHRLNLQELFMFVIASDDRETKSPRTL